LNFHRRVNFKSRTTLVAVHNILKSIGSCSNYEHLTIILSSDGVDICVRTREVNGVYICY